jgi:hypothetical protein
MNSVLVQIKFEGCIIAVIVIQNASIQNTKPDLARIYHSFNNTPKTFISHKIFHFLVK